jgi:hypothetical protein
MVMDIVDIWVNLVTETSAREFVTTEGYENIPGYLGSNTGPVGVDSLVALMDELGVATGIVGLASNIPPLRESTALFGLLQIAWFVWLGIVLLSTKQQIASA